MNKRNFLYKLGLTLTGCGGGSNLQMEDVTIELNGDSLLLGYLLETTPEMIICKNRPKWVVTNKCAGGLTLNNYFNGYKEPYLNAKKEVYPSGPQLPFKDTLRQSKFIVIELGSNDAYIKIPPSLFEYELREIIDIIKKENRIPILTGIPAMEISETFNQETINRININNKIIRQVCIDTNSLHAGWDIYPFTDSIDGIHKTQEVMTDLTLLLIKTIDNFVIYC